MDNELQANYTTEQTYHSIRHSIVSAQRSLCAAVNSAMVTAYWEIGEQIYKACGENDRAGYGKKLLQYLSAHLTAEFGKDLTSQICEKCASSTVHIQFETHCVLN